MTIADSVRNAATLLAVLVATRTPKPIKEQQKNCPEPDSLAA